MKNFKKISACVFLNFFFVSLSVFFVDETDLCFSSDEGKNLGTHHNKRSLSLSLSLSASTRRTLFIESLSLSLSLSLERRFGTCSRFVIIPRIIYFKRCRR